MCECIPPFSITALITKRFTSLWRRFDIFYATFGYKEKREQQRYIRIMHDFADEIIEKRRAYLINQQQKSTNGINGNGISAHADDKNVDDNSDLNGSKKMVFLDVLLQATVDGRPLSNEEIIEEANTFMFAVSAKNNFFIRKKNLNNFLNVKKNNRGIMINKTD